MSRIKFPNPRILLTVVLAASLLGVALWNNAGAAKLAQDPVESPTSTDTLVLTDVPAATDPPTATPTAPRRIVISEFRTRGQGGDQDEFVELYNPTGGKVDIGGWTIKRADCSGVTPETIVTIPSGTTMKPGQHYLAASDSTDSNISNADITFSAAIADDDSIGLVNSNGTVDAVNMCSNPSYYYEGDALQPLTDNINQSYERKPGGDTSCYDTNNNTNDFALISPSNPQNSDVDAVMCAGVSLYTPTKTSTITPTRTPTPRPTSVPGYVVINEFLPHPDTDWNSDGTSNVFDEYIELINLSSRAINVKNWRLDTGAGSKYYLLPDLDLQPREIAVFFRSMTDIPLSDGGATVRLLKYDGSIADAFTYPVVAAIDQTWCRMPDGGSTWGFVCRPTPGRPNAYSFGTTLVPGFQGGTSQTSFCQSINNVPDAILQAECGSYGAGITGSNSVQEKRVWIESRLKWEVFVE